MHAVAASLHQSASVAESGDPTGVGPVVFTCRQGSGREGAILVQDTVAASGGPGDRWVSCAERGEVIGTTNNGRVAAISPPGWGVRSAVHCRGAVSSTAQSVCPGADGWCAVFWCGRGGLMAFGSPPLQ